MTMFAFSIVNRSKIIKESLCSLIPYIMPSFAVSSEEVNGKGYHYAYMKIPEACTGCTNCAVVCPDGVITVYRVKQN